MSPFLLKGFYLCALLLNILLLAGKIFSAQLGPSRAIPSHWFDNYPKSLNLNSNPNPIIERHDQEFAATGHKHGRVQIKVFRGPTQGGHHEHFAPHGYWVKQPADQDSHH